MRTYIPGVPPMLTGPATAFLGGQGAPMARRRGMSAAVTSRWHAQVTANGADPMAAT